MSDCYDCCLCDNNGLCPDEYVSCEKCNGIICYKCLGIKDQYGDMFGDCGLKSEFCQNCVNIEKNKYVYVVLIVNNYGDDNMVVYRDLEGAEAFRDRYLNIQFMNFTFEKKYEGNNIVEEMKKWNYYSEIKKFEIYY